MTAETEFQLRTAWIWRGLLVCLPFILQGIHLLLHHL